MLNGRTNSFIDCFSKKVYCPVAATGFGNYGVEGEKKCSDIVRKIQSEAVFKMAFKRFGG